MGKYVRGQNLAMIQDVTAAGRPVPTLISTNSWENIFTVNSSGKKSLRGDDEVDDIIERFALQVEVELEQRVVVRTAVVVVHHALHCKQILTLHICNEFYR